MQTICFFVLSLAAIGVVSAIFAFGRMIGECLPGHRVKERFGIAAALGFVSILSGSIAIGMVGLATWHWRVNPWMHFWAWSIAFLLASQIGLWSGWRKIKRTR